MIGLDTNVLVRYILRDDAHQTALATHLIEHTLHPTEQPGFIASIVLCEIVWVLQNGYGYTREQVAETLQRLFEVDCFRFEVPELAWRALDGYRAGADFADALLALVNEQAGCEYTASFDRKAARLGLVRVLTR